VIEKCRKCDKVGETTEHGTRGCLSLSEFANIGRRNQLAKIIHHQTAIKYKLLDIRATRKNSATLKTQSRTGAGIS